MLIYCLQNLVTLIEGAVFEELTLDSDNILTVIERGYNVRKMAKLGSLAPILL